MKNRTGDLPSPSSKFYWAFKICSPIQTPGVLPIPKQIISSVRIKQNTRGGSYNRLRNILHLNNHVHSSQISYLFYILILYFFYTFFFFIQIYLIISIINQSITIKKKG